MTTNMLLQRLSAPLTKSAAQPKKPQKVPPKKKEEEEESFEDWRAGIIQAFHDSSDFDVLHS